MTISIMFSLYHVLPHIVMLIVQSSTASPLSELCSMCRMLAGLHTVVCAQTNLVGRGERRRLVKYWVVRWSRGVSVCVGVSEARAAASP